MSDSDDRIQFRLPDQEELKKRAGMGMASKHQVARRDLRRYYLLLDELTPTFPKKEAQTLVAVHNGHLFEGTERTAAQILHANVEDGPEMYVEGHDVDREAFSEKLQSLSLAEKLAAIDAIELFWANQNLSLEDVGLVEEEENMSTNGSV